MAVEWPHFIASIATVSKEGIVPVPGGVLIFDEAGTVIGAAGASGDTSDNDEAALTGRDRRCRAEELAVRTRGGSSHSSAFESATAQSGAAICLTIFR